MKVCENCNTPMINNAKITGQHPFELGVDGRSDIYVSYVDGKKEVKGLFGKIKQEENCFEFELMARVCPKCGKVELYIDLDKNENVN